MNVGILNDDSKYDTAPYSCNKYRNESTDHRASIMSGIPTKSIKYGPILTNIYYTNIMYKMDLLFHTLLVVKTLRAIIQAITLNTIINKRKKTQ